MKYRYMARPGWAVRRRQQVSALAELGTALLIFAVAIATLVLGVRP